MDWLTDVLQWVLDLLLWIPRKVYELFLTGILAVIEAIPVPSWAENISLDWIPSSMGYFLEPFNVPFGLLCITGGYLWRFLVRRIPVIG